MDTVSLILKYINLNIFTELNYKVLFGSNDLTLSNIVQHTHAKCFQNQLDLDIATASKGAFEDFKTLCKALKGEGGGASSGKVSKVIAEKVIVAVEKLRLDRKKQKRKYVHSIKNIEKESDDYVEFLVSMADEEDDETKYSNERYKGITRHFLSLNI